MPWAKRPHYQGVEESEDRYPPTDKEFRQEMAASPRKKAGAGDEYLAKKADTALARLRAINE